MNLNNILWVYNTRKILQKAPVVENLFGMKLSNSGIITTATGNPVRIVTNKAQNAISTILSYSPKQSGSGDPSPSNVRPIEGWTEANLFGCGKNLFDVSSVSVGDITFETQEGQINTRSGFFYNLPKGTYTARCNSEEVQAYIYLNVLKSDNSFVSRNVLSTTDGGGWRTVSFAVETGQKIAIYAASRGIVLDVSFMLQIELGSQATDYVPFIAPTETTISLGGTYYGFSVDVERGMLRNTWGYIAEYDGEELPGRWISDRDVYSPNTSPTIGAEVAYELATPTELPLTPQTVALLAGNNTIWTDGDSIEIAYRR